MLGVQREASEFSRTHSRRTLKNLWSKSCAAVGRLEGSFTRHLATISRMACIHACSGCPVKV